MFLLDTFPGAAFVPICVGLVSLSLRLLLVCFVFVPQPEVDATAPFGSFCSLLKGIFLQYQEGGIFL